jgi:hypothetical protein
MRYTSLAVIAHFLSACAAAQAPEWQAGEAGILQHQVQLTTAAQFAKAGESYFSPDGSMVIFQAVPVPPAGQEADPFYGMYVARIVRDPQGRVSGLSGTRCISPAGSANTCGWFHPREPGVVIFATTIGPPTDKEPPGFESLSGRYRWMFPPEMRIVRTRLSAGGAPGPLETLAGDGTSYRAEGSLSADGRHLLYCSLESGRGDLFVKDLHGGTVTRVVGSPAYDGGPFFSPDGRRICFRADRREPHYLQLYVGELALTETGAVAGLEREHLLTDGHVVNWCPFWHPGGRHLIYASSEVGHHNYEVFVIDADPGDLPGSDGTIRYGTRKRRVTHAEGADVLPAFSPDGRTMIWTSQRGEGRSSQLWAAEFEMDLDGPRATPDR